MAHERDALITGIGLISSLGTTLDDHWDALANPAGFTPAIDTESFAPFIVHPMVPLQFDQQIPKRDQRQMETWQRLGTFAAGLALESAGLKDDAALLAKTHMVIAAGGGERDDNLDIAIMAGYPTAPDPEAFLNQKLAGGLRPTLFLAQLSNLLAGGIAIVHGVTGSSRTFMGEEASAASAIRTATARIASGQADIMLVGGAYNAQRPDLFLLYQMNDLLRQGSFEGVWSRQATGGGMILGSVACFLVIESRHHAERRGARSYAHLTAIRTDRCQRQPGQATANARRQLDELRFDASNAAIISAASGASAPTQEEHALLDHLHLPIRSAATALGHSLEPSLPASIALSAIALQRGKLFGPLDPSETIMPGPLDQVLVTAWGHRRGETSALLRSA